MLDGQWAVDLGAMAHSVSLRRLLAPLVLACLAVALPATASAAAPCANANLVPTATNGAQVRSATLCLINRERTSRGLVALRQDGQLRKVANGYSRDMVTHGFFAHVGYDGSTVRSRISKGTKYLSSRVSQWSLGENLYWGSGELSTPQESVQAWMHSPGHRANMLNKTFRDIGIGIAIGAPENVEGSPAATYATEFGTRSFH
jgi:uncharacterized protein YkwD